MEICGFSRYRPDWILFRISFSLCSEWPNQHSVALSIKGPSTVLEISKPPPNRIFYESFVFFFLFLF